MWLSNENRVTCKFFIYLFIFFKKGVEQVSSWTSQPHLIREMLKIKSLKGLRVNLWELLTTCGDPALKDHCESCELSSRIHPANGEISGSDMKVHVFPFFFFSWCDNLAGRLCTILHIVSVNYTQLYKMIHIYHFYSMNIHNWMFLHIAYLKRNGWLRVWRMTVISHVLPSVVSFSERGLVSKKLYWKINMHI